VLSKIENNILLTSGGI